MSSVDNVSGYSESNDTESESNDTESESNDTESDSYSELDCRDLDGLEPEYLRPACPVTEATCPVTEATLESIAESENSNYLLEVISNIERNESIERHESKERNESTEQSTEQITERTESPTQNSYFDYFWIISRVLRDKCWHTLFTHFDVFEKVQRIYPDEESYSWRRLLEHPSPILPNLYLGSAFNAADYKWLKKHNINIIVNATDCISNFYPEEFKYYQFPVEDLESGSMAKYYEKFVELMISSPPGTKTLVHCFAGRSRSASLILFYLIKTQNMNYEQALIFLKHRRPLININREFVLEIQALMNN